jgi:hypothetical protein
MNAIEYLRTHLGQMLGQPSATSEGAQTWEMAEEEIVYRVRALDLLSEKMWVLAEPTRRPPIMIGVDWPPLPDAGRARRSTGDHREHA